MRKAITIGIGALVLSVIAAYGNPGDQPPASPQNAANAVGTSRACNAKQDEAPVPKRVAAGTYCVCDAGPANGGLHPTTKVKGEHLHLKDPVVIAKGYDQVDVKLGTKREKFNRLEDGMGLSAMLAYPHVDHPSGGNQKNVMHLVNISRYVHQQGADPPGDCDVNKNVITISYCYWDTEDAAQQWKCADDIPDVHLGDIHAQN